MIWKENGVCEHCGKHGDINVIDGEEYVCDECLDSLYTQCEECGEYYSDDVEFFCTNDGRLICEYCKEESEDEN